MRNALENAVEIPESPAEDEGQDNSGNESSNQDSSAEDSKEESSNQDGSAEDSKEESSKQDGSAGDSKEESSNQDSSAEDSKNEDSQDEASDKSDGEQNSAVYKDGTYIGEALCFEDDGFTYTVLAAITVKDGILTDIQVEKINVQSEVPEDNEPYMEYAINGRTRKNIWYEGVVKQILDSQSTENVDAVSSATYSSNAIVEAVSKALKQAAGEEIVMETVTETEGTVTEAEGTVTEIEETVTETEETVMETSKDESTLSVMNTIFMAWNNLFDKSNHAVGAERSC